MAVNFEGDHESYIYRKVKTCSATQTLQACHHPALTAKPSSPNPTLRSIKLQLRLQAR